MRGFAQIRKLGAVVIAAFAAALACWASTAAAATPATDYFTNLTRVESPNPQANGQWAQRMRTVPDLNGDGKNEILVSDYRESFGGFAVAGRVYVQDGATRAMRYFIDSPQIQANSQFGFVPAVIGDVSGDGKADFVAGADGQDTLANGTPCTPPPTGPLGTCNQDQGKAWVFSGATGHTLYELNMPNAQGFARFGIWTGRAGDINSDGVPDILVGASTGDVPVGCGNGADGRRLAATSLPAGCHADEGEAFIFSGKVSDHAAGASGLLRTLNLPASDRVPGSCGGTGAGAVPCGFFGLPVQGVGDVTGDGVIDHQVGATSWNFDTATNGPCANPAAPTCNRGQGAVYLLNGATGALIRRTDDPVPEAGAQWGLQDGEPLAPGDVTGDGRADYSSSGALQSGPSGDAGGGRSWVFNGATGAMLYEVKDPTPTVGGAFGFSLARTDYNKDGTPDLYVGQNPHHPAAGATGKEEAGGTFVFDGRDGSLLKSLELPPSDAQAGEPNNLGSNLGWSIVAPGDLNGDGEPDYVAGAPFEDVDPNGGLPFNCQASTAGCVINVGREYFFLSNVPRSPRPQPHVSYPQPQPATTFPGCPTASANVIRGSAGSESINGTPLADRIFAGTGNDVVDGLAANDCIDLGPGTDSGQGGNGNDLLLGGLGRDRISGNLGNDRLRGQSGSDKVNGGGGRDRIDGGSSSDVISGGSSNDRVAGGQGNDRINGSSGNDSLVGNSGRDRISGSTGKDRISGGSGKDRINARDRQRDWIDCGAGRDTVIADSVDRVSRNCERVSRRR